MNSYMNTHVNKNFCDWLNAKYGEQGDVTYNKGKIHSYLSMYFNFAKLMELIIGMEKYMENMVKSLKGKEIKEIHSALAPLVVNGFKVDKSKPLNERMKENFYIIVAMGLYMHERKPHIHTAYHI